MQRYDVIINGNRTTLLLSEVDAAARGLTATPATAAAPAADAVPAKSKTPANKSRKPANKRAEAARSAFAAPVAEDGDD